MVDPYDYDHDWTQYVSEEKKREIREAINETPVSQLGSDSLSLINTGLGARNSLAEAQEDLEKLPAEAFGEKWYWLKKGYWFFERPESWRSDEEKLISKIQNYAEDAKRTIGQSQYAKKLNESRKEKAEAAVAIQASNEATEGV